MTGTFQEPRKGNSHRSIQHQGDAAQRVVPADPSKKKECENEDTFDRMR
jgi:predicted RNA binding protein YcfA (HicA-like mRNA interferase family)